MQRQFRAARPDALWVADVTYVRTVQGFFYLAMILDVFSRRIVGWMMGDTLNTGLVTDALQMALHRRDVGQPVVHHSDRGSTYTAFAFSQRLTDAGVTASLGSVGDSFDNAMAESWFSSIKIELLYRYVWPTRHDAELAIFRWIEGWFNPRRIQEKLGWRSPAEYEHAYHRGEDLTVPATAKPAPVLPAVKAKPSGRPPAGLDNGSGPEQAAASGTGKENGQQQQATATAAAYELSLQ